MFKGTKRLWSLAVIAVMILGVIGCEDMLQDALDIKVDMNEPLFNDTYNEPVTHVNVATNLIVSNSNGKAMKTAGFGSAEFSVTDTRKLLFSLDFGSVTVEADIFNASSMLETISFYFSTNTSLSDPIAGGASLVFSEDLASGANILNESLTDGVNGLNQTDATVVNNLKNFFAANQGLGTYTVYAVMTDGAETVTINSFSLDVGAVLIQTKFFTSDSLDKYSSENAQLEEGYIEGSVINNGTTPAIFKIYLGVTNGQYPSAGQVAASKVGIAAGTTYAMSKENKNDYLANEAYLNEKLTELSNGTVSSVEANLYIYSGTPVNVTLNSAIRGTVNLGN